MTYNATKGEDVVATALKWTVIENTPGYLPEEDDPAIFDDRADALVYMSDRLSSYLDFLYDGDVEWDLSQGDGWYFVTRKDSAHDLGRNFSVEAITEEN